MLYFQMHKAQVSALWFWDFTFVIWEKTPIDFSVLPSSPDFTINLIDSFHWIYLFFILIYTIYIKCHGI